MAVRRLLLLPSLIILLFYIGKLVAVVERQNLPQGVNSGSCNFESGHCHTENVKIETLSSVLTKTESLTNVADMLSGLSSAIPVNFEPQSLDFKEQPIGMPRVQVVKLTNPTNSLTLQLISISGTHPEFHTSFFVDKVLRPGESTTFDVVFLARTLGLLSDTILIHSSLGLFEYKIRGIGMENPFRLRSLRGARIPLNTTYEPVISMYNPYGMPLQILEVYSSGGDLQLELPNGIAEGNKTVWDIRPFETKTIARVKFLGHEVDNHTEFIRIKTNHPSQPSIILPFEVEVCREPGLFVSREFLDFGTVRSGAESKLSLYMINTGPYVAELKSINVPDNSAVKINFTTTTLKPSRKFVKVALLTFSSDLVLTNEQENGILKIGAEYQTSYHVQELTIPYEAKVLRGTLKYDMSQMLFRVHEPPFVPIIRNITLINQFDFPVVIYSAKFSSRVQNWFSVLSFQSPVIIPPDNREHSVLVLKFTMQSSDCFFNTTLRLSTNISFVNIPLQCYDGRLDYDFGGRDIDAIEFGLLSDHDTSSKLFTITNINPVRISVTSIGVQEGSNLPSTSVHVLVLPHVEPNGKDDVILASKDGLKKGRRPPYYMDPGQQIVFRVNVTRPKRPGRFSGEILIHSSLGKIVHVPVNYEAIIGGIQILPKKLYFASSFLYSSSNLRLYIKNTFTKPVKLVSLMIESINGSSQRTNCSEHEGTFPVLLPMELPVIKPSTTTVIGDLMLDPLVALKDLYIKIDLNDTITNRSDQQGQKSLKTELYQLDRLWRAWQSLIDQGLTWFNFTLKVKTKDKGHFTVPGVGSISWPKIATSHILTFPLTLIGNYTERFLHLHNPSNNSLFIEPIFLPECSEPTQVLGKLSEKFNIDQTLYNNPISSAFAVITDGSKSSKLKSSFVLPPRGKETLRIGFSPKIDNQTHGLLLLRNNLTVLESVQLVGFGSRGFITIDGVHPHGPQSLLFEFSQSVLDGYINGMECGMQVYELLSYAKVFHVRNSGPTPFTIKKSSIDGLGCDGNGFRITNCDKPLIVYPNRTRKIEVICSPDFTLSRVTSTLHLHTADGSLMDFPLVATLPHTMLATCYAALPHSELEELAAYVSVPLWMVALLVMILATIFQVNWHARRLQKVINRVSSPWLHSLSLHTTPGKDIPVQSTGGSVFDLSSLPKSVYTTISERVAELGRNVENVGGQTLDITPPSTMPLSSTSSLPQTSSPINEKEQQRLRPKIIGHNPILYETRLNPRPVITTDHHTGIRLESDSSVSSNGSRQHEEYSEIPEQRSYDNTAPASSPTKKLKNNKRLHQKGPEKQFLVTQGLTTPTSPTSSVSSPTSPTLHPISLTTAAVAAVKQEQFQRKESDESIRSSESDLCSGTSSSSDPVTSLTPDPEETPVFSSLSTCKVEAVKLKPSYAKEPWTGQTVEVKDNRDEGAAGGEEEEVVPPSHPPPPVTVKPRSKKKQKAQQKKEEKQRRKQQQQQQQREREREREREEFLSKKIHDFQESFDKESIASNSTNSTDNLDDETSFGQGDSHLDDENLTREEEEQEISMETNNNSLRDDNTVISRDVHTISIDHEPTVQKMISDEDKKEDIEILKQEEELVRPVEQIVEPVEQVVNPVKPVQQVVNPVKPVIDPVYVEEIETCPQNDQQDQQEDSFTDTHIDETSIIPSQLEPLKVDVLIKLHSTDPPVESQQLEDTISQEIQEEPSFSLENAEEEQPRSKIRPQNLDLTDKKDNSLDLESTLSSVETDGKPTLARLSISSPHELATSVLNKSDIIVRRSKLKGEKMASQPHKENEEVKPRKKMSADMSVPQDKRSSQLSHDAQPFYPIYPHYLPQQHPHIPPPPHHHGGPLLPSHSHRMSSPPYEYMPMRPGGGYPEEFPHAYHEQIYDQRYRKRSDHQKPQPKGFIPSPHYPYPIEGMPPYHHDRPPPPRVYEPPPEWMGSHSMHDSSHLEEDTRSFYASKRRGEMRGGHLPPQSWHKVPLFDSSHPGPKHRPHGSTLSGERGEYMWDHHHVDPLGHPSQSQTDDVLHLARYNHMRKMHQQLKMEKQRQLELDDLRHDMYSLAQLRERSHLESDVKASTHYCDFDMEHESLLNEVAHLRQLHNKEKLFAKQQAQESTRSTNLSLLLSPSSGWGPLNRAPGSQPGFSNQSPSTELASLFDTKRNTRWSPFEENSKDLPSTISSRGRRSSTDDDISTWQRLWSMNSPLSNALEEQRLQAATLAAAPSPPLPSSRNDDPVDPSSNQSSHNPYTSNYDPFETSIPSIWSFTSNNTSSGTRLFSWDPKPYSNDNNND